MSAFQYYKSLGYSYAGPKYRDISNAGANLVVWQPTSSMRIALTEITISAITAGTIALFFGGANNAQKLGEFISSGSVNITPSISSWESTAKDAPLYAVAGSSGTNGWRITVNGFELE